MEPSLAPKLAGEQLRKRAPRTSHAEWTPLSGDDRDPVAILEAQAVDRVAELVPIRYGRMLESSFAFYRGAAAVMAYDLARTPTTGLSVQLCGDAHLVNFGGFSAPDRALVFDLNDFDETLPGPFEWDLKRLTASFAIAGRSRGFSAAQRAQHVQSVVESYRSAMRSFAQQSRLEVWYARLAAEEILGYFGKLADAKTVERMRKIAEKSQTRTSTKAFSRYTELGKDGLLHPVSQPPLLVPLEELLEPEELGTARAVIADSLEAYGRSLPPARQVLLSGYELVGVSRKVVGVGSVGTRCWIALFVAKDDPLDDLVLQVKEAGPSVMEQYLQPSEYANNGQRVVEGQKLVQAASDTLLGWERNVGFDGRSHDYYVRQMWDGKVSADPARLTLEGYLAYAAMCGWTLARAHARSGDRKMIAGYLGSSGKFADSLVAFAESYADQNEADYVLLQKAAAQRRIEVVTGQ